MSGARKRSVSRRSARHGPQRIGNVLAELMARTGFAGRRAAKACEQAWREAAGPLAAGYSRPGRVRRGVLEVVVANSALVQELAFEKPRLLEALQRRLPEQGIRNIRFRVGSLGDRGSVD